MQQVGFSQPCARDDLIALCAWAGLRVTKNRRRFATSGLTRIAGIATRNGRSNNYHHAGHFAHVVMAAAVLAGKAGIGEADRELLVREATDQVLQDAEPTAISHGQNKVPAPVR